MSSLQRWELEQWAVSRLHQLLPLNETQLQQVLAYTLDLSLQKGAEHLHNLLGDSGEAVLFISEFGERRTDMLNQNSDGEGASSATQTLPAHANPPPPTYASDDKRQRNLSGYGSDIKPLPVPSTKSVTARPSNYVHTNVVIDAAKVRAIDEVCYSDLCSISFS
jgi:hypothetical protein